MARLEPTSAGKVAPDWDLLDTLPTEPPRRDAYLPRAPFQGQAKPESKHSSLKKQKFNWMAVCVIFYEKRFAMNKKRPGLAHVENVLCAQEIKKLEKPLWPSKDRWFFSRVIRQFNSFAQDVSAATTGKLDFSRDVTVLDVIRFH